MRMQKRQFRIGTLAQELGLEKFVIRFWEKEFNIKSQRSSGGQRYYTTHDVETFRLIKDLLYIKKFTIKGAKEALIQQNDGKNIVGSTKTTMDPLESGLISKQKLVGLRNRLKKLQELL